MSVSFFSVCILLVDVFIVFLCETSNERFFCYMLIQSFFSFRFISRATVFIILHFQLNRTLLFYLYYFLVATITAIFFFSFSFACLCICTVRQRTSSREPAYWWISWSDVLTLFCRSFTTHLRPLVNMTLFSSSSIKVFIGFIGYE